MKLGVVLISNYIGGTEKRICNLYKYLLEHSEHTITIIINQYLVDLLRQIDFLGELESVLHILPGKQNMLTRFVDSPTDIFHKSTIRIPGPNWVIQRFKKWLRPALFTDSNYCNELDLVHYTGPFDWDVIPGGLPILQEAQDTEMGNLGSENNRKRILNPSNITICASPYIRDNIIKALPSVDTKNVIVSPCSFIDYSNTRIEQKQLLVVFSGRLIPYKNAELFLEAIEIVLKQRRDIKFRIMGKGRLETKLNGMIQEWNMGDNVEIGFVKVPVSVLAGSLIFVSLQDIDNYHSQALMEAMACGCAIIASDVGYTSLLVDEEVGCRIPIDVEILAQTIIDMVDDRAATEAKGVKARIKVMSSQNITRYADFMNSVFDQALERSDTKPVAEVM